MAQITHGIRRILNHPLIYNFMQFVIGANRSRREYIHTYVKPQANDKILDIGCGTGDILHFLPKTVEYFGIDLNNNYIEYAKKKYGSRGTFLCNDIKNNLKNFPLFDIILANGILHHLNDDEATNLFNTALSLLKSGGRLITLDCCYVKNQSKIARFIIRNDRGQNIRFPESYETFAKRFFGNVLIDVRYDLLKLPYTHTILVCSK